MEGREREMEEERRRHGWRVSTRELVRCSKGRGWLPLLYCPCISVCCTLNSSRLTRNLPQCCSVNFRIKSCHARARNDQQGRRAHLSAASVSLSSRQMRLAPAARAFTCFTCLELVFDEAIYNRGDLRDAASSGKQHRGVGALSVHGMCAAQVTPYRAFQRSAQPTSASSPSDIRGDWFSGQIVGRTDRGRRIARSRGSLVG